MKIASLFLSLLVLAAPLHAQPLPGDSVYHLQASTQAADGQPVAWSSLRGQPRVVSMFYTNCHLMCPLIIENAKAVQKQLPAASAAGVSRCGSRLTIATPRRAPLAAGSCFCTALAFSMMSGHIRWQLA